MSEVTFFNPSGTAEQFKTIRLQSSPYANTGSLSYLDAGAEQTVVEVTPSWMIHLNCFKADMTAFTQSGTFKIYEKIDGTTYRQIDEVAFTNGTDFDGVIINLDMIINKDSDFKITYTEAADETAARAMPFQLLGRRAEQNLEAR